MNIFDIFGNEFISMFNLSETLMIVNERKKLRIDYKTSVIDKYPDENYSYDYCVEITYFVMTVIAINPNFGDDAFENMIDIENLIRVCTDIEKIYCAIAKLLKKYDVYFNDILKELIYIIWYEYPTPYLMGRSRSEM